VEIEPSVPVSNPSEDKSVEIEKLETWTIAVSL
jgi:hypothetical protein